MFSLAKGTQELLRTSNRRVTLLYLRAKSGSLFNSILPTADFTPFRSSVILALVPWSFLLVPGVMDLSLHVFIDL